MSDPLTEHLASLVTETPYATRQQADAIRKDPQAHIDALVEAGVLRPTPGSTRGSYQVVQPEPPHEHRWGVLDDGGRGRLLPITCVRCGAKRHVTRTLPIEVPE